MLVSSKKESVNVAPLQFITFINNDREIFALIDSGAQVNLIDKTLLSHLQYVKTKETIKTLRGVNNASMSIATWVPIAIHLPNGSTSSIPFALVEGIKSNVILGLWFLTQIRAKVDPYNKMIESPE